MAAERARRAVGFGTAEGWLLSGAQFRPLLRLVGRVTEFGLHGQCRLRCFVRPRSESDHHLSTPLQLSQRRGTQLAASMHLLEMRIEYRQAPVYLGCYRIPPSILESVTAFIPDDPPAPALHRVGRSPAQTCEGSHHAGRRK